MGQEALGGAGDEAQVNGLEGNTGHDQATEAAEATQAIKQVHDQSCGLVHTAAKPRKIMSMTTP